MPEERVQGLTTGGEACRRFELELAAYLDGEDRPAVSIHARECPFCRVMLGDLEQIRTAFKQIPLEEPPARVWTNIRQRLESEGVLHDPVGGWRHWLRPLGLIPSLAPVAALACVVILGSILLVPPAASDRMTSSLSGLAGRPTTVATAALSVEDNDLARTVEELETSYKARAQLIEPAVKATYEKGLECLNTSIRQCQSSVQREPDNDLAQDYLRDAYTRKAEVLAAALEYDAR